jgi:primosomal protein N' (replication factor Y)
MTSAPFYLNIALPVPLNKTFDYLPEPNQDMSRYQAGLRVSVSFANRTLTGVIVDIHQSPTYDPNKLKPITELLDSKPLLSTELNIIGHWLHTYYHQPLGQCMELLWPVLLRKGGEASSTTQAFYRLNDLPATHLPLLKGWLKKALYSVKTKPAFSHSMAQVNRPHSYLIQNKHKRLAPLTTVRALRRSY